MLRLRIYNLPDGALGVHKVEKVKILEQAGQSYALILLDNQETFTVSPRIRKGNRQPSWFTEDEQILLCSEGKEVELFKTDIYGK